jgi:hypothetical protein
MLAATLLLIVVKVVAFVLAIGTRYGCGAEVSSASPVAPVGLFVYAQKEHDSQ